MPRKNNRLQINDKKLSLSPVKSKRRYPSERLAQGTADYQMLLNPSLKLKVYKDIDGGWYLTRIKA